jgi:hypothetical protein
MAEQPKQKDKAAELGQQVSDRREEALKSPEYLAWQEYLDELRKLLKDVSCDRIDAGTVGELQGILIGGEALEEHVATDSVLLAAKDTVTAMILVEECKQKITAVAQSLGWSISDIRTLFEPTGSFAWQALRAAAEVQTVGSSPRKAGRDRLVTVKEVAEYLRIHRNSMRTRTWPVAAVKHKGNQPDRYCWSELRPVLEQQYPDEDWGSF